MKENDDFALNCTVKVPLLSFSVLKRLLNSQQPYLAFRFSQRQSNDEETDRLDDYVGSKVSTGLSVWDSESETGWHHTWLTQTSNLPW